MGGLFRRTDVTDQKNLRQAAPPGWGRKALYRLSSGRIHLVRKALALAPGLSIEETRLVAGAMRLRAELDPGVLQIGAIDAPEMRAMGLSVKNLCSFAAYGGCSVNLASHGPATLLLLSFDAGLASWAIPEHARAPFLEAMRTPLGPKAAIRPVTPTAWRLLEAARGALAQAESPAGEAHPRRCDREDDIMSLTRSFIEEVAGMSGLVPPHNPWSRCALALDVESLLLTLPDLDAQARVSIDDAARRLAYSRRSIQLAVNEEFGLGFLALKRSIRLQQAHALLNSDRAPGVGCVARALEFNHLSRFSLEYRKMFGVPPSTARASR